jgi:hypothetical protein
MQEHLALYLLCFQAGSSLDSVFHSVLSSIFCRLHFFFITSTIFQAQSAIVTSLT